MGNITYKFNTLYSIVVLPNLIPKDQLNQLKDEAHRLAAKAIDDHPNLDLTDSDKHYTESGYKIAPFFNDTKTGTPKVSKLGHALHDNNPTFERFCHSPLV